MKGVAGALRWYGILPINNLRKPNTKQGIQATLQREAVQVAATFVPVLTDASAAVAQLDVLQGFAQLSISSAEPYVRPRVTTWGAPLVLRGSRHPLLEVGLLFFCGWLFADMS